MGRQKVLGMPLTEDIKRKSIREVEKIRKQIERATDPLKFSVENGYVDIKEFRKQVRKDENKRIDLFVFFFIFGYGLFSSSLYYLVNLSHMVHTII